MPNWRVFKHVVIALAALGGALGVHAASAQPYPARDITFIVAFAPGGVADTLARFVGKGLGERLGRTVVVENRGGAGGNIAAAAVARAAATRCCSPPRRWRSTRPCARTRDSRPAT
jgi:tripartite-type tricarboxylate transporter receptor subunit TctC